MLAFVPSVTDLARWELCGIPSTGVARPRGSPRGRHPCQPLGVVARLPPRSASCHTQPPNRAGFDARVSQPGEREYEDVGGAARRV